ncbi:hypothetical protein [Leptospira abararensis]|uniref:hypothetical protein n=1 Tax=Leptospira abararensis TaxID=2810036 RepID=UPI001E496449|nr:hypothetical protein [Leptospira abararensis]
MNINKTKLEGLKTIFDNNGNRGKIEFITLSELIIHYPTKNKTYHYDRFLKVTLDPK